MNKPSYTPGPWTVHNIGELNAVVFIDEGSTIGGIYRGGEEDILRPEDARLIAAAPDMAEALLAIRCAYRTDWRDMTPEEKNMANRIADDDSRALKTIDAALRKAGLL